MMPRREPTGVIHQPSRSGSGGDDGLEFIRCVGGQEPQIHKIWSFAKDVITRKVHPFARIDVGNFNGDFFHTAYDTEIERRVFITAKNPLMEALNGLAFLPLLVILGWLGLKIYWFPIRVGETDVDKNVEPLENHSRPRFRGRSVPWHCKVPCCPAYVPSSPENERARARHVCTVCLWENRLEWDQTLFRDLHFGGDEKGNGSDDSLDGWVHE